MINTIKKGRCKVMWGFIYIVLFLLVFVASVAFKLSYTPKWTEKFSVNWNDSMGTIHTDISYGELASNKFDLYLPADNTKENYGLVVYLHAGGFTMGDKSDDAKMLEWLCSKGYVAAGINYTLRNDTNNSSVLQQSNEIRDSIAVVMEESKKLGYNLNEMTISGGSAGGALAMIYAYRDGHQSPLPVKLMFQMVGPSSFYAEDWGIYGLDQNTEAAANLFGVMGGVELTADRITSGEYVELMKQISAAMWVNENSCPSLVLYGKHDTMQPFKSVRRLIKAYEENKIDYQSFEAPHSGHGVQNDDRIFESYMDTVVEYLDKYMPVN